MRVPACTLMSPTHVFFKDARKTSSFVWYLKAVTHLKNNGWGISSFSLLLLPLLGSRITAERGNGGEKRRSRKRLNRQNRKVSVCALTALDVGLAEALLKLFGGEF